MNIRTILGVMIFMSIGMAMTAPAQAQIYVDVQNGQCDDAGTGTMQVPFCKIQAAYDFASTGAQIRVQPGTYSECLFLFDLDTQKDINVVAEDWITPPARNNTTIIDGSNVPSVDCEFPTSLAPASVVNLGGFDSSFVGFTVTGGSDSGIFGVGSVVITDNIVEGNSSTIGGGIYVYSGNCYYGDTTTTIQNNLVRNNSVSGQGGGVSIAAGLEVNATEPDPVLCPSDGDAVVNFADNVVENNVSASSGGGIYTTIYTNDARQATVAITQNMIRDNSASTPDGQDPGVIGYGAGIYGLTYGYGTERIEVIDNQIERNSTLDFGGGMQLAVFPNLVAASNDHQHLIKNNIIDSNSAGRGGGGMESFASVFNMTLPQAFSVIVEENTITNNRSGTVGSTIIDDPNNSFGGGGLLATFESLSSTAPAMEYKIRNNVITNNSAKVLGGGVSVNIRADAEPGGGGGVADAEALVELTNNWISANSTDSAVVNSVGGGVFAFLEAKGPATATLTTRFNTVSLNTLDNQTEPAGFHVESLTTADSQTQTDGQAAVLLDSSIVALNGGVGFGGPLPGQPGIKTPGGTAEFSVATRYNDLFANSAGGLDGWVVSGIGNITGDPFLDPMTGAVGRCSPTIDAADPALAFSLEPPPNGGRANMGFNGGTTAAQRSIADVNGDGLVDGIDIVRLSVAFGTVPANARFNPDVDLDNNSMVDGTDLAFMSTDFGLTCPQ